MILIFILAIAIIAVAAFITLPGLCHLMIDSYDEWTKVHDRIKRRTKR